MEPVVSPSPHNTNRMIPIVQYTPHLPTHHSLARANLGTGTRTGNPVLFTVSRWERHFPTRAFFQLHRGIPRASNGNFVGALKEKHATCDLWHAGCLGVAPSAGQYIRRSARGASGTAAPGGVG
ncbi:hypothetical protein MVI01_06870 [Myxococcus virescens]|uniref:Uncharacterized protein n=1 Tax=Myxococcus virescens TaxID=83456 RepID=A0A511H5V0_9BACT|nr:hypothetical protein MVI01_06870 [Myxococcus virescens]